MAFGTPVAGALAYSAQGGTSVAPAYPASIAANDVLVLVIGMKPSTANGGTVTTPTGWTLRDSITGQGGYATTLGIDTGNTNLYVYTKDTVAGTETGSLTVTVGTNNVCWAAIIRVPGGGSTSERYGTADGGRSAAPTSGVAFTDALTNGATAPNISAGDVVIYAMCVPTDVLAGAGFSAQTISSTGTTFATPVELREASSATGNDIGGYIAYASATAGSSTAAPTIGATATGTTTNIRGPLILLSIRQTSQTLTQSARFDNTNAFYGPTVTKGAANLAPARYNNTNVFYTAAVAQIGGVQALTQTSRYTNTNVFYSPTSSARNTLSPARYNNTNTFYSATVGRGTVTLAPIKLANLNVFYSPTVSRGAVSLQPARFNNSNTIYSLHITQNAWVINQHTRLDNANTFYPATVSVAGTNIAPARFDNTSVFYASFVTQGSYVIYQHERFNNTNTFYSLNIEQGAYDLHQVERLNNTNEFFNQRVKRGLTVPLLANINSFFSATAAPTSALFPARYTNSNTFYSATASIEQFVAPPRLGNQNTFYSAHVAIDQFIATPLVANANTIYAASASSTYRLSPIRVASSNVFYSPSLVVGPAFIVPSLFSNQNRFYKQSIIWWDSRPSTPETWDGVADTPVAWSDLPIVEETWDKLSATETTWDSV